MNERRELGEVIADLEQRLGAVERRPLPGGASPGGWLFLGIMLGAAIVGCCWLLSLRAIREAPAPLMPPPAPISCDCGTVSLVNPQDWARVLFDTDASTGADGDMLILERLP